MFYDLLFLSNQIFALQNLVHLSFRILLILRKLLFQDRNPDIFLSLKHSNLILEFFNNFLIILLFFVIMSIISITLSILSMCVDKNFLLYKRTITLRAWGQRTRWLSVFCVILLLVGLGTYSWTRISLFLPLTREV